jgi:hypothetical protein
MRKIEMKSWEEMMLEEVAQWDAFEIANDDQFVLELLECESYDELFFESDDRDLHRWELDPASAEDYGDRVRTWKSGPAQKWRHFGH